jgi:transcriptional regulator with XRE-family HTH domain
MDTRSIGLDFITHDEKGFFQQLGARIAEFRKSASITQVQLADTLGVSQQTVATWEVGRRGAPIATLPALARALRVSVETLIGETPLRPSADRPHGCSRRSSARNACPRRSSAWSCRSATAFCSRPPVNLPPSLP